MSNLNTYDRDFNQLNDSHLQKEKIRTKLSEGKYKCKHYIISKISCFIMPTNNIYLK